VLRVFCVGLFCCPLCAAFSKAILILILIVRLLARFHCVVDVGIGLSWMMFGFGVQFVGQVARV